MKKTNGQHKLRMTPGTCYVWVAGSCDYGHEERWSGGAYTMMTNEEVVETYVTSDDHTTEFRMILTAMIHAMKVLDEGSDVVFLTNVAYIQQNFDRDPDEKTRANADLIDECRRLKERHHSVEVRLVPFHKYHHLTDTNQLAHEAMRNMRMKK